MNTAITLPPDDDDGREQLAKFLYGSCLRKIRYESAGLAAAAALSLLAHHPEQQYMGAYRCQFCHDWHNTSIAAQYSNENYLLVENPAYVAPPEGPQPLKFQTFEQVDEVEESFLSPTEVFFILEFYYARRRSSIPAGTEGRRIVDRRHP